MCSGFIMQSRSCCCRGSAGGQTAVPLFCGCIESEGTSERERENLREREREPQRERVLHRESSLSKSEKDRVFIQRLKYTGHTACDIFGGHRLESSRLPRPRLRRRHPAAPTQPSLLSR
jgi:hypothetical protein